MSALTLTHSDVKTFMSCRRAWRWSYLEDRSLPEPYTGPLAIGTRVHGAILDGHYRGGDAFAMHEQLAQQAIADVEAGLGAAWDIDEIYYDVVVSRNCVEAYMEWLETEGADHGYEVQGVEDTIEVAILDGRVILKGKTDLRLLVEVNGSLVIVDLKTTGHPISRVIPEYERSFQSYWYRAILRRLFPELHVAAARYRIVKKVSRKQRGKPFVEEFQVPGMLRSQKNIERQILGVVSEILSVIDRIGTEDPDQLMYTTPGDHCAWCPFKIPCMIFNEDPVRGAEMLDENYAPGRHRRYDVANAVPVEISTK